MGASRIGKVAAQDPARCLPALLTLCAIALLTSACKSSDSTGPPVSSPEPASSPAPPPPPALPSTQPLFLRNADQEAVRHWPFRYDASGTFALPGGSVPSYEPLRIEPDPGSFGLQIVNQIISGTPTRTGTLTVTVTARTPAGPLTDIFSISIREGLMVARPNGYQFVDLGEAVDYDVTQGGTTFAAPGTDPLSYEVSISSASRGLTVDGTRVTGMLDAVGLIRVHVIATHPSGGRAEDEFAIVAAAPLPGSPSLPDPMHVYDDNRLPLPLSFRQSRQMWYPYFDTTPLGNPTTDAGATLGRVLFYDQRLSITNTVACGSCHRQSHGFANPEGFARGFQGELTRRNVMPLGNVRYNEPNRFFSDMRAETLEQLALIAIEDEIEMGNVLSLLEEKLAATDFYPPLFAAAFGTPEINRDRIARALAQFLRSLISYRSRFDATHPSGVLSLEGVLTNQEIRGLDVFSVRCGLCHETEIQAMTTPMNNGLDAIPSDPGWLDRGAFRAASLRNIAVSAPHMHDARFATLREVIEHYDSGVQDSRLLDYRLRDHNGAVRRLHLSEEDKGALEAFLHALTDEFFLTDPKFSDPFER